MVFDFIARSKIQINLAPIIKSLFIPSPSQFDNDIAIAAANLTCGRDGAEKEFAGFIESFDTMPCVMSPTDRITTTARLDALVAHAYGLSKTEYQMILDSFKKFDEDPSLHDAKTADWSDNKILKVFYGEVRKEAMRHFEVIAGERGGIKK